MSESPFQDCVPSAPASVSSPGSVAITVSELNRCAREILEQRFPLLWVSGEISNLARPASGHLYFTLKDESAQVRCAMFRNRAQAMSFRLENGMKVEARALVSLFEARGDYQLNVDSLRRAGVGALFEAFIRLRDKLTAQGLFAESEKRPLPVYPRRIGVVTSLQAAALKDILAALARRAPQVPVVIYPTGVQGDGAAAQIVGALKLAATRLECDVLILARGGGSLEDLWPFNEEILARALHASPIPVVSGVGHETDTTIADYAADCRAATPSAAAELVSAGYVAAGQRLAAVQRRLHSAVQRGLEARMQKLDTLSYRLVHPGQRLERANLRLAHLSARFQGATLRWYQARRRAVADLAGRWFRARPDCGVHQRSLATLAARLRRAQADGLAGRQAQLTALASHLAHLDPEQVLARGYSIVRDEQGAIVRSAGQLNQGSRLELQFGQGRALAEVLKKLPD